MNEKLKHLCLHMWSGIHITPEGYIHLCGISKEQVLGLVPPHIDDIENLQDFFNSDYFIKYRNMKVEENEICIACTRRETSFVNSLRNMLPRKYGKNGISANFKLDDCKIEHLDVCFNNLCNQQCVMCKSECSSKWFMSDKENAKTEFNRKPVKYKKWTTDGNMKKIFDLLPQLKILQIKGGEPLIQDEVKQTLLHIIDKDLDINVEFLSNFQELSDEMLTILHSLKNLSLRISLDSSEEMYNWTRGGDWNKTIQNLEKFMQGRKHKVELGYTNTLNRWSYKNLIEDIKKVEEINRRFCEGLTNYNILPVMGPKYTSPFSAPLDERLEFIFNFEKEYGFITHDSMPYKTLRLNHLFNILSLENDPLNLDDNLTEMSDRWKEKINRIRSNINNKS